jgi:hypothetical protein
MQLMQLLAKLRDLGSNRDVLVVPYKNPHHNPDMMIIRLCEYIVLPENAWCITELPDEVVKRSNCSVDCNSDWYCVPKAYGLYGCSDFADCHVNRLQTFDLRSDDCVLHYKTYDTHDWFHEILFQDRYIKLFNEARESLGFDNSAFIAVHWRRFDSYPDDTSVNALSRHADDMLKEIDSMLSKIPNKNTTRNVSDEYKYIYIATNEKNMSEHNFLRRLGFKTHFDLKLDDSLNSMDRFIIELQLMIECDRFFHWGHNTVSTMIKIARKQRNKYFLPEDEKRMRRYKMMRHGAPRNAIHAKSI